MGMPLESNLIQYQKIPVWKYRNYAEYEIWCALIRPKHAFENDYLKIDMKGNLTIKVGYAWDGCSGPTHDDDTNMRAGKVHDALYNLMRIEVIDAAQYRKQADIMFRQIMIEDGAPWWRAWYYYRGVRLGGGEHVTPASAEKWEKVYSAP